MNPSTTPDTFERHLGLGGSDVAAALGLSPFKTPLQLWAEKRKLPSALLSDDALHLRLGHHLEPFIAAEFERQSGLQTHTVSEAFVLPDYPMFYGHIDRFVTPRGEALWSQACGGGFAFWLKSQYIGSTSTTRFADTAPCMVNPLGSKYSINTCEANPA